MKSVGALLSDRIGDSASAEDFAHRALGIVRRHLGMDVAYLSEFVDGELIFRAVDAPGLEHMAPVGGSMDLRNTYCRDILAGRLPQLIPDTAAEPIALAMPITQAVPIGSHVSIPVRRSDGSTYGMFCCVGMKPNPSLNSRDLEVMRMFADLTARELNAALDARRDSQTMSERVDAALAPGGFRLLYQPIFELGETRPAGFEALCRFTAEPYRSPDVWFAEAAGVGRQVALECAVIAEALRALGDLPDDVYVSVNASPETVVEGDLPALFSGHPCERILLEVTEHAAVADYALLHKALEPLRYRGVQLAIDDAGAGYSGLQHILMLRPDVLKLDMTLTRDVDKDRARRSLAAALVHFASETRAEIVAEGIETEEELRTLLSLNVHRGQGYFLGRPAPLEAALAWWTPRARESGAA